MILLKNVLRDDRFIEESKVFSLDLILTILKSDRSEKDIKELLIKAL